jgi:hypothetical protein
MVKMAPIKAVIKKKTLRVLNFDDRAERREVFLGIGWALSVLFILQKEDGLTAEHYSWAKGQDQPEKPGPRLRPERPIPGNGFSEQT